MPAPVAASARRCRYRSRIGRPCSLCSAIGSGCLVPPAVSVVGPAFLRDSRARARGALECGVEHTQVAGRLVPWMPIGRGPAAQSPERVPWCASYSMLHKRLHGPLRSVFLPFCRPEEVSRPSSCPPRSRALLSIRSFFRLSAASSLLGCLPVWHSPLPRSTGAAGGDDAGSVVPPVGQDLERGCAGAGPELVGCAGARPW